MVHMGDQLDYGQFVETIHKENSFNVARSSIIEYGGVSKVARSFRLTQFIVLRVTVKWPKACSHC